MMRENWPFKITLCLACEDIREEKHGKHSLMGLYTGDILISDIPGNVPMAFFMEFEVKDPGKHLFWLRLSGPGEHNATLRAEVELPQSGALAVLKTPRIDLLVDAEGIFTFDISTDNENWENLLRKEFSLASLSNGSLQPSEQSQPAAPDSSSPPEPSRRGSPRKRRLI
jgi:hypothetical protein